MRQSHIIISHTDQLSSVNKMFIVWQTRTKINSMLVLADIIESSFNMTRGVGYEDIEGGGGSENF